MPIYSPVEVLLVNLDILKSRRGFIEPRLPSRRDLRKGSRLLTSTSSMCLVAGENTRQRQGIWIKQRSCRQRLNTLRQPGGFRAEVKL